MNQPPEKLNQGLDGVEAGLVLPPDDEQPPAEQPLVRRDPDGMSFSSRSREVIVTITSTAFCSISWKIRVWTVVGIR
jgi:hypothetical protein